MNNISMNQALSIWDELWHAYYCNNGYGSDIAEIYAYRLMAYRPTLNSIPDKVSVVRAQNSLYALLSKFAHDNDCEIEVDGKSLHDWMEEEVFDHRCHVKIIHG